MLPAVRAQSALQLVTDVDVLAFALNLEYLVRSTREFCVPVCLS